MQGCFTGIYGTGLILTFSVYSSSMKSTDYKKLLSTGSMLLKAKLGGVQKFARVSEPSLKEF